MPTLAHEVRLHDDTHTYTLGASCMNLTTVAASLPTSNAYAVYSQQLQCLTMNMSSCACMLNLIKVIMLCATAAATPLAMPPIAATQSNIRAPQRPHSLQHATSATCNPMLPQIATLQHYMKCHDILWVQQCSPSRITALPHAEWLHSCS